MKAIRIHSYGNSSVLKYEDAWMPKIAPDDVMIKVHSAGVNPADWKLREGRLGIHKLPCIPGWDVAGTVEHCGVLVSCFKPGDPVFSLTDFGRDGSYAEYIVVRVDEVAHAPKGVPLEQAAGAPMVSLTAWKALFEIAHLEADQSVLIHGASGGVGNMAVQFAKIADAYVIGTTSALNVNLVKGLGADKVIDYRTEDFSKKVEEADVVFDTIGGETQTKSFGVLRPGGVLVSIVTPPNEALARQRSVEGRFCSVTTNGGRLQEVGGFMETGKLKVVIDKEFPLSEAKAAQEYSQTGRARGKIILRVAER